MSQIESLLQNEWIEECGGPWGSSIVPAANPPQEHVANIDNFIWNMCVSYQKLNEITKPFEFTIPCCDNAIISVSAGSDTVFIISLDARQGYHKVQVRKIYKEELYFFAPNNEKY